MKNVLTICLVLVAALGFMFSGGCQTNAQSGAGLGLLGGALLGQAIGGNTGATLLGGAIGAGGGYMVGNEMDKQKTQQEIQAARQEANTCTINILNSNGSITPVVLRRWGSMWIGPKGEQYLSLPTAEQLKPVYGF